MADRNKQFPLYSSYVDGIRVSSGYAHFVAQQLINRAPKDADAQTKKALKQVGAIGDEIQGILGSRLGQTNARVAEPRLGALGAFGAAQDALLAKKNLGDDDSERAGEVLRIYFGEARVGRTNAGQAWSICDRTLKKIDADDVGGEIDALIGPAFLATLRARHATLGEASGVGRTVHARPDTKMLINANARFTRASSLYLRLLAAQVDEEDERSIARFETAVGPIDEYREQVRSGVVIEEEEEEEDEGDQPTPTPTPSPTDDDEEKDPSR